MSRQGIIVGLDKVNNIIEWPTPKNVAEVRYFMGLTGYYRRCFKNFSKIGCPITDPQKKGKRFEWIVDFSLRFNYHHKYKVPQYGHNHSYSINMCTIMNNT